MDAKGEKLALFRYGLIAPLILEPLARGELTRRALEIASRQYEIPDSKRHAVSVDTLLEWAKRYRTGGFEALAPKPRQDRGQPRSITPQLANLIERLQRENPIARARLCCANWHCPPASARHRSAPSLLSSARSAGAPRFHLPATQPALRSSTSPCRADRRSALQSSRCRRGRGLVSGTAPVLCAPLDPVVNGDAQGKVVIGIGPVHDPPPLAARLARRESEAAVVVGQIVILHPYKMKLAVLRKRRARTLFVNVTEAAKLRQRGACEQARARRR
jgi:Helix-turn-helix domain